MAALLGQYPNVSHRHEGGLEEVVGEEVPAEVEEVVDDVDLALLGLAFAERLLQIENEHIITKLKY